MSNIEIDLDAINYEYNEELKPKVFELDEEQINYTIPDPNCEHVIYNKYFKVCNDKEFAQLLTQYHFDKAPVRMPSKKDMKKMMRKQKKKEKRKSYNSFT
jgi:hypothetical protein